MWCLCIYYVFVKCCNNLCVYLSLLSGLNVAAFLTDLPLILFCLHGSMAGPLAGPQHACETSFTKEGLMGFGVYNTFTCRGTVFAMCPVPNLKL